MNIQPIDVAAIEAELERLRIVAEAARRFNASLSTNGEGNGLTRGQKVAASRAANRKAEEERAAEKFANRSAAMKKAWKARNK